MGRRGYPAEFRRRTVELIKAGKPIAELAVELEVSEQTLYTWRRQMRMDEGLEPGLTSSERAELVAARLRIRDLEAELTVYRRSAELLAEKRHPKSGTRPSN